MKNCKVPPVSLDDCVVLEGAVKRTLEDAIKEVCPGWDGVGIWDALREKYVISGFAGQGSAQNFSCQEWVVAMNAAIIEWNSHCEGINNCENIKQMFDLK